jgi:DNA topoisomerase-3
VHEKYKKFQCMNPSCDFAFWKIMGGRQIEPDEADTLLTNREVGPLEGFAARWAGLSPRSSSSTTPTR